MEMKTIAGKHKCGKEMEFRIIDVDGNTDKKKEKKVIGWIIYGVCKKCNEVLLSDLIMQEAQPIQNVDFRVDYELVAKGVKNTEVLK